MKIPHLQHNEKKSLVVLGVSIVLLIVVFLTGGTYCPDNNTSCSLTQSLAHLQNVQKNTQRVASDLLSSLLHDEEVRYYAYLQGQKEYANTAEAFEKYMKETGRDQILMDASAQSTAAQILSKETIVTYEESFLRQLLRERMVTIYTAFLKENITTKQQTYLALTNEIMPRTVNLNEYVRFFDGLQKNLHTVEDPFEIQQINIQEKSIKGELYDTVDLDISLLASQEKLRNFLRNIYLSGDLSTLRIEDKQKYPMSAVNSAKINFPVLTPATILDNVGQDSPTVVNADIRITIYLQRVTTTDIEKLTNEINTIKENITQLQEGGKTLPAQDERKRLNTEAFIEQYTTDAEKYMSRENYREAYTSYLTVKELYNNLLKLYL